MFTIQDVAKKIYEKDPKRFKSEEDVLWCLKIYFKWIETCITSDRFYDVVFGKLGYFAMKKQMRRFYSNENDIIRLRSEKKNVSRPDILLNPGEKYRYKKGEHAF